MNEDLEMMCFQIITYVGTARSCYINAIQSAKSGDYKEAQRLIDEGEKAFSQGHESHGALIAMDARGELSGGGMILMHAEDQLMSAEGFRIIAAEFIDLYKKLEQ